MARHIGAWPYKEMFLKTEFEPLFIITIGSHFFKITNIKGRMHNLIYNYCRKYVQYGMVKDGHKMKYAPVKVFAASVSNGLEFRFHIGQFNDFLEVLDRNSVTSDLYDVVHLDNYRPKSISVNLRPNWELRDYQLNVLNFTLTKMDDDLRSRLVSLPTGTGKTLVSCAAISKIKTRTIVIILPTYIDKWCSDITMNLDVSPKEITPVQGSGQLKGLIGLAQDKLLNAKFIIVSLTTIKNFFKSYEKNGERYVKEEYGCTPEELFPLLEVGTMIIDEVHQHLHGVFKTMLYTHINKIIALSATFTSNDQFILNMQKLIFPKEIRYDKVKKEQYVKVRAIAYSFYDFYKARIKTTQFRSNKYSHTEFEKSILRNQKILRNYLTLINDMVLDGYINEYMQGDKLAIYASSILMCTEITEYLKYKYKHLDVRRYVEDDPYENVIDADIRVSTILSSGTALDIPDLRTVIMTTNIDSPVANLQTLGRLRKLKDRDVKFYYIYCTQIPKQVDYHRNKKELFASQVASIKELDANIKI